ncbi:pyridine nucleotide-disulfide oxidoreductase, partial [Salmonella enterica subsp. enterica serovar Heidelberg str. N18440]
ARLGILGGGYIGLEFASMFANFGTKVTIFEAAPQFLPREDRDIAQAITRILQEKGVELILNANVQAVSSKEGQQPRFLRQTMRLPAGQAPYATLQ